MGRNNIFGKRHWSEKGQQCLSSRTHFRALGTQFATLISLVGIGIVAIPTGVISASFVEEIRIEREAKSKRGNQS